MTKMEKITGYVRLLAHIRVKQQVRKALIGKPHLRMGQAHALFSYFFQLGGILGAKHSRNLDAFGLTFLGAHGPANAVHKFFTSVYERILDDTQNFEISFGDYIGAVLSKKMGHEGDPSTFLIQHLGDKVWPHTVEQASYQHATEGAAIGALHADIVKRMFDLTYSEVPKDKWQKAVASGLDIPPEQDVVSYDEMEVEENEAFMEYCREYCAEQHTLLSNEES
jgi:hypothetical protein